MRSELAAVVLVLAILLGAGAGYVVGTATERAATSTSISTTTLPVTTSVTSTLTLTTVKTTTSPITTTTTVTATAVATTVACPLGPCAIVTIPDGAGVAPPGYSGGNTTYGYNPDVITVVLGVNNTVYWVNDDSVIHSATGFQGTSKTFDSGPMFPGAVFHYTFTSPGNYTYRCVYHAWMQGIVIVK